VKTPTEFIKFLNKNKYDVQLTNTVLSITANFSKGNIAAYRLHEDSIINEFNELPLKGGSIWGSTSDGIGGFIALERGKATFNISFTTGKRWVKTLHNQL